MVRPWSEKGAAAYLEPARLGCHNCDACSFISLRQAHLQQALESVPAHSPPSASPPSPPLGCSATPAALRHICALLLLLLCCPGEECVLECNLQSAARMEEEVFGQRHAPRCPLLIAGDEQQQQGDDGVVAVLAGIVLVLTPPETDGYTSAAATPR